MAFSSIGASPCREALIYISNITDSKQLVVDLQDLLVHEGGIIQERSFPVELSLKIKKAIEDNRTDHSISLVFAYAVKPEHAHGDIVIRSIPVSETISTRLQLSAIAKFDNPAAAVRAMVNLLDREGGDITLDKFPAEDFYALNDVIQNSIAANEIATGFAYTIKDKIQPYGTAYFAFEHPSSHLSR